jgi:hypothetical protein
LAQALATTPDEILAASPPPAPAVPEPPLDRKKLLLGTIDAFLTKVS